MRPVSFTFASETQVEICATNATAASGAVLVINGGLSNYAQRNSPRYIAFASPGPGVQRAVEVFSTGNISTSTFTVTGFDLQGYQYTTSFAGPTGTAGIAQSGTEFARVTAVSVGNTLASSPFTVGFGPSGTMGYVCVDNFANPNNITYAVIKAVTSGPLTFQHTFDDMFTATAPTWSTVTFSSGVSFASQTTATSITITENPKFIRVLCVATAAATGPLQATIVQSGV